MLRKLHFNQQGAVIPSGYSQSWVEKKIKKLKKKLSWNTKLMKNKSSVDSFHLIRSVDYPQESRVLWIVCGDFKILF